MQEKKEKGMRFNEGKIKWSLVDFEALEPMVKVLAYGTHKYSIFEDEKGNQYTGAQISPEQSKTFKLVSSGKDNWKKGLFSVNILDSLMRHAIALQKGEINDPESGLPHIGHLMSNAMFLSHNIINESEFNNLPKIEK